MIHDYIRKDTYIKFIDIGNRGEYSRVVIGIVLDRDDTILTVKCLNTGAIHNLRASSAWVVELEDLI